MPTLNPASAAVPAAALPSSPAPATSFKQRLFLAGCIALAVALLAVAGSFAYTYLLAQAAERTRESRNLQLQGLANDLQTEDSPYTDAVNASIHLLRDNTLALGQPNIGPAKVTVSKEAGLPDLRFGTHSVANDFTVVDEVTKALGGTATLFVRSGTRFVRVTTNVFTSAGTRAIGTELDPQGVAIASIRENKTFTGVVDVLGKSYYTVYQPIHGADGDTIGIWYVGYPIVTSK